jgi:hypothetical protein
LLRIRSFVMMAPSKPQCWVKKYDELRLLPFEERNLAVDQLKAIVHAGVPIACEKATKNEKREGVPRTKSDERLEDLKRRLDKLEEARGYVRPPRPDPPVFQSPPRSVRRYPTPEAMRKIRARRLHLQQDIQPNIQPSIGTSIWPDSRGSVTAAVHVPTTIRCQTIKGLLWGNVDIDKQERLEGIVQEMRSVGSDTFRLHDMISCHEGTNGGQALSAMIRRIDTAIAKRMPDSLQFKIGITWNPPHRWANPQYGYQHDGFISMEILAWDFRAAMIGLFEAALINHFQREAPRLCLNKKLGDDNRQDMSPQFLYVAYLP